MSALEMRYHGRVDPRKVEAFFDGRLGLPEMVLLAQDILEAGAVQNYGPRILRLCVHFVNEGLCTTDGRYLS